jgi:hypothetical protein
MAIEHRLKTSAEFWDAIYLKIKPFEIRRDDRGFKVGDILVLEKYGDVAGDYVRDSGGHIVTLRQRITYVLPGGQFGIEPGFSVLGIVDAMTLTARAPFCEFLRNTHAPA